MKELLKNTFIIIFSIIFWVGVYLLYNYISSIEFITTGINIIYVIICIIFIIALFVEWVRHIPEFLKLFLENFELFAALLIGVLFYFVPIFFIFYLIFQYFQ
jgi:hypothetical protein